MPVQQLSNPRKTEARGVQHAAATRSTTTAPDGRFLPSGDQSGTAPGDRKFRPDVEGLRAIAVLLVVLYHARIPWMTGGYVGVDVFFVISGFVITGLLLRERAATAHTHVLTFYGRRARRIVPAASLVTLATVLASYHWLGFITGDEVAADAHAAILFFANFHFIGIGTNYLTAQRPPSPLQNLWSLSVEEQFYFVYPAFFILAATLGRRLSLRLKLSALLVLVIAASLAWSIHQTPTDGVVAYFSPFTHAWELALGCLVAVMTTRLSGMRGAVSGTATWAGFGCIFAAAVTFGDTTQYPGYAVALPVVGAALVIAGGVSVPRYGVERLLRLVPLQWLGKLSYSLYLWHWPLLAVAAQRSGKTLSVGTSLVWVLVALVLSIATYLLVENPIRHASFLTRRPVASIALGVVLTVAGLGVVSLGSRLP
jgi:peptidoglycan/LPS O-acetylase OafA/YrhL